MLNDITNKLAPIGFASCSSHLMEFVFKRIVKAPLSGRASIILKAMGFSAYSLTNTILKNATYEVSYEHYINKYISQEKSADDLISENTDELSINSGEVEDAPEPLGLVDVENYFDLL